VKDERNSYRHAAEKSGIFWERKIEAAGPWGLELEEVLLPTGGRRI